PRRHRRTQLRGEDVSRSHLSIGACVGAAALLPGARSGGAPGRSGDRRACGWRRGSLAGTSSGARAQEAVKLGVITKFPVGFYFTLQDGAKKFDKQTPGATVVF